MSLILKRVTLFIIIFSYIIISFIACTTGTRIDFEEGEMISIEPQKLPGKLSDYTTYSREWFSKAMDVASSIRGLDFNDKLSFYTVNQENLPELMKANEEESEEITNVDLEAIEAFYKQIGYLDEDFDYSEIAESEDAYDSILGFYTVGENKFAIVENASVGYNPYKPVRLKDVVAVHELTHALQDMNFNLSNLIDEYVTDTDSLMSFKALVEGDATLTQYLFMIDEDRKMARLDDKEKEALIRRLSDRFASFGYGGTIVTDIPSYWVKGNVFVYLHGAGFVSQLYLAGGYDIVNEAYTKRVPISSEQILHPVKYIKNDVPVNIKLEDLSETLNKTSEASSWERIHEDTLGEYNLFLLIEKHLKSKGLNVPKNVSEGWDGDEVNFYKDTSAEDTYALVWVSVWDTTNDADEFYDAYVSMIPEKRKLNKVSLVSYGENKAQWKTEDNKYYVAVKKDKAVFIIEEIPQNILEDTLNKVLNTTLEEDSSVKEEEAQQEIINKTPKLQRIIDKLNLISDEN